MPLFIFDFEVVAKAGARFNLPPFGRDALGPMMAGHTIVAPPPLKLGRRAFGHGVEHVNLLRTIQQALRAFSLQGRESRSLGQRGCPDLGAFRNMAGPRLKLGQGLLAELRGEPVNQM